MKKQNVVLMLAIMLFGVSNVSCIHIESGVKPSDKYITRNYKVEGFDKINLATIGKVHYIQSTDGSTSVSIYGPDNFIELMEVGVENNTLVVNMKKRNRIKDANNMLITLSSPQLHAINYKGAGSISTESGLNTTDLEINNTGVGDVSLNNITCDSIRISTKGVGNIIISGSAEKAVLWSKGVGNIEAADLKCQEVNASSNGIGNISCYATESISASVKGIGNIHYGGNPKTKNLSKGGIGAIKSF